MGVRTTGTPGLIIFMCENPWSYYFYVQFSESLHVLYFIFEHLRFRPLLIGGKIKKKHFVFMCALFYT